MDCESFQEHSCAICTTSENVPPASEKGRKYCILNKSRKKICKVKLDGCYFPSGSGSKRCDFMFVVCESGDTYFIELKDEQILKAVEQIQQTLEHFSSQITGKVFARIVVKKVSHPRAVENDARVLNLQKRLKRYGGNLKYESVYCEERI